MLVYPLMAVFIIDIDITSVRVVGIDKNRFCIDTFEVIFRGYL